MVHRMLVSFSTAHQVAHVKHLWKAHATRYHGG